MITNRPIKRENFTQIGSLEKKSKKIKYSLS